jgi:lipopolysaccharide biosynthesis regulator YciM
VPALRRLIRLAELTREWERAIELQRELERSDRAESRSAVVAHYLCELADQARQSKDLPGATAWLDRAEQNRQETARVLLVRAAIASDSGDHAHAARCYRRVAEREPSLLIDVLPRLAAASKAAGEGERFSQFLADCLRKDPKCARSVELATILDPSIDDPLALKCLWDFIAADLTLQTLIDGQHLKDSSDTERHQALQRIRGALRSMAASGRSYRCLECGYTSVTQQWQCPGCGAWDTVRPRVRLAFESGDR